MMHMSGKMFSVVTTLVVAIFAKKFEKVSVEWSEKT